MSLELFVACGARVRILCSSTDSVSAGPAARGKYDALCGAGVVCAGLCSCVEADMGACAGTADSAGAAGIAGMGGTVGVWGLCDMTDLAVSAGALLTAALLDVALPAVMVLLVATLVTAPLSSAALPTAALSGTMDSRVAQMGVLPNSSASGRLTGRAGRGECVACGVWFPCWTD